MQDLSTQNLTAVLQQGLEKDSGYDEALEIARTNSSGKLWLVGGAVYRMIVAELYQTPQKISDYDFLTEEIPRPIFLPEGWNLSATIFGNPSFHAPGFELDLFPLSKSMHWDDLGKALSAEEQVESYFRRVPLNIQAIAYDVDDKKLMGEEGIKAITEKTVKVNCLKNLQEYLPKKGISLEEYISSKAEGLGFVVVVK
ncbi:hypothetical protein HYX13_03855 [Candidatus Woesearchaeota archaeon]|nr:hypothetical protein [Candidatus Woesearchaeota archaeon]